ncbi:diguanylate cyclase domain-containing protein [Breznakiellaceae bacterium SP9]
MLKLNTPHGYDPLIMHSTELFATLLPRERDYVISKSSLLQLRKGGKLFGPGGKAEHFYMLLEGTIRIVKPDSDGAEDEKALFTAGDTIADFDFARATVHDVYAQAVEDCMVLMFPGFGLSMDAFANEEPHTISRILLNSIVMMSSRIKATHKTIVENMSWIQELHRRAYEDPVTGLWNHSFLDAEIIRILEDPTALIMVKPDRFKVLNDTRGHKAGDEAMVSIAAVLKNEIRKVGRGWPLRFKSNEVGILLNQCNLEQSEELAADLQKKINAIPPLPEEAGAAAFAFTASIVYTVWPLDNKIWQDMFTETYTALLDAWRTGGNCIVHYTEEVV